MGKHAKTLHLLEVAAAVLAEQHPMTVRQVYYQLVSRQVIENTRTSYANIMNLFRAIELHIPEKIRVRREHVEPAADPRSIRAKKQVLSALQNFAAQTLNLRIFQRFATADGDNRRGTFFQC